MYYIQRCTIEKRLNPEKKKNRKHEKTGTIKIGKICWQIYLSIDYNKYIGANKMKLKYLSIKTDWLGARREVKSRSLFDLGGR